MGSLQLTPVLLSRAKERHPRVAAEALKTLSALLNSSKPVKSGKSSVAGVIEYRYLSRLL